MRQTFYIESDEEIISVIGRLRHSSHETNYFIFPKRSLVLQSIINLKLFQREAEKLGKKVIIVTQDEVGMMLAEKVGLPTERYSDEFSRQSTHLELVVPQEGARGTSISEAPTSYNHVSEDLGSTDFYAAPQIKQKENTISNQDPGERLLRVRDASPLRQTSLNSKRVESESLRNTKPPRLPSSEIPLPRTGVPSQSYASRQDISTQEQSLPSDKRDERLKNFFGGERGNGPVQNRPVSSEPRQVMPKVAVPSRKVGGIFLFLGSLSLISLVGVLFFLFLPRAEVHVVPYKMVQNVDLQFDGRLEGVLTGEDTLPVRILEKNQDVSFTVDATGAAAGTAQKARGTIVIYNKYSTDPQSLVATTRFESVDGKIFRLITGVTVPGMVGSQAGATEALIIADQPGSDYNIAGTTFTVPGFKGSPKYDKFSAQSNKAMSGGSDATGSGLKVISKEDIDKADGDAREKAKEAYLAVISPELSAGEKVLEDDIDITPLENASLPLSGTVANSFEYKNTFKIRGFIFSETAIKEKIMSQGEENINNVLFRPVAVMLTYGGATPDYEAKTLRLKVHASIDFESFIDQDKLVGELMGKNSDGINAVLASFPEIKKIQVVFKPPWFPSVIPTSPSRVTIIIDPGSSE